MTHQKFYEGRRTADGTTEVMVVDGALRVPLPPRLDLENKSPTGFNWGYGGSGPAQLALAMIADATGSDQKARAHMQEFKRRFVAHLDPAAPWSISREAVKLMVGAIERDRGNPRRPMRVDVRRRVLPRAGS